MRRDGQARGVARWSTRHRWLAASLVCTALAAVAVFLMLDAGIPAAHAAATRYGADLARTQSAVQAAAWPQQNGNWCGVATVSAIANYQGHAASQSGVATYLGSAASVSAWGTAPHTSTVAGPGFAADIAGDFGTDPRALTAAIAALAVGGYHQLVDLVGATDATNHLVADVARSQQPISVIVDHGAHSVLVSAVFATANPVTNPSSVTALEVWDPGFGIPGDEIQGAQMVDVPLSTWLTSIAYWGSSYSANVQGSVALDPDPSVGPYTYNPSQNMNGHLWIGHYVYIRPDQPGDAAAGVSRDWAFAQNGALITGQNGEVPAGYTGPTVPLQPPPPPPTATPRPATPTPTRAPTPTRVPTVVPTKAPTAVPTATQVATVTPMPTEVAQPTATAIPQPTSTPAPPATHDIPIATWVAVIAVLIALGLLLAGMIWLVRRRGRRGGGPPARTTVRLPILPPEGATGGESSAGAEREAALVDAALGSTGAPADSGRDGGDSA